MNLPSALRAVLTVFLLAVTPSRSLYAQRPGNFTVIGPGGGGAMYHAAISPHDTNTVLVACDMTGSYITHDGGKSWRMFNLRGVSRQFFFDPTDSKVIYDVGVGLWKSSDSGTTWKMLWPAEDEIRSLASPSDHAEISIVGKSDDRHAEENWVTSAAVDPGDSKHLVASRGGASPALWESRDGGAHWKHLASLPSPAEQLAFAEGKVWIAGAGGFSLWDGRELRLFDRPAPAKPMTDVSVDTASATARDAMLLSVVDGRLSIAKFSGQGQPRWVDVVLPGAEGHVTTAAGGHDGHTVYASFHDLLMDGKKWQGLAKSVDAGAHWTLIWKDAGNGAPNFTDGWISESHGSDWGGEPLTISVSSKDPSLVYATDLGRTMKSSDAGEHWQALYSHAAASGGGAVSSGLDVLTSYGTFFDPFDAHRMFIAYTDVGLFRSEDGGKSWISSIAGIPAKWRNTTYWIAFDPKVRGRIWAAVSGIHDLPRPRMWRHISTSRFHGGICVSDDGGKHWKIAGTGLPEGSVTHILLDPASPVDARVLYAAVMGQGIYKSVDGGATWQRKSNGIVQGNPLTFRLIIAPNRALYAIVVRRSEDGSIGNAGDGALYRSTDAAESWQPVALPAGVNAPNGLLVDSRNPSHLFLAAWARATGEHGEGGGIYASTDSGAHWKPLFTDDQHIYDMTVDPAKPNHLFATGFESSAWQSMDGGDNWQRIAGFNFHWGHRVVADQTNPGWVYINTFGGGVWHGRVDGRPAIEDIATKKLMPGRLVR